MITSHRPFAAEVRRLAGMPTAWYGCFVIVLLGVVVLALAFGLPVLAAAALALSVMPPVFLTLVIVGFIPVRRGPQPTVLPRLAVWAGRLIWTALTFAFGAFVATLVGFDLARETSGVSANDYFYRFLATVVSCVAIVALIGLLGGAVWTFLWSDVATRSRAALRALTTASTRDALPLRASMWLDESDNEPMPKLALKPRADHTIRVLASDTASVAMLGLTGILIGAILMTFPTILQWIA